MKKHIESIEIWKLRCKHINRDKNNRRNEEKKTQLAHTNECSLFSYIFSCDNNLHRRTNGK